MRQLFLLLAVFFGILVTPLKAQTYNFELLSMDDGLPSNHVYTVLEDRKGYLWIATDKGVVKYNGTQMKIFTTADGLVSNDVWDLQEDSKGRIWLFCFADKMQYIQNDKVITAWKKKNTKFSDQIVETNGAIYVANKNTVTKFQNGNVSEINMPEIYDYSFVLSENAFLQMVTDSIYTIVDSTNRAIKTYSVTDIAIYMAGKKYMVDSSFIYSLKNDSEHPALLRWDWLHNKSVVFDLENMLGIDNINWFVQPYGENIQIYSSAGFLILDKDLNEIERFLLPRFKGFRYGDFVLKGRYGATYNIIYEKGVYVLPVQKENCLHYDLPQQQSASFLGQNYNNHLLIGSSRGIVYELIDNQLVERYAGADLPILNISYMGGVQELSYKSIGYTELRSKDFSKLILVDSLRDAQIGALKDVDINRQLGWVSYATSLYGVIDYSSGESKLFEIGRQYATVISNDSLIWYGGPTGLVAAKGDSILRCKLKNRAYGKGVKSLVLDKNQNVWVGTDGYGVYAYQKDNAPIFVTGCEYDIVSDMVLSPFGNLWVATNNGIKEIEINYNDKLSARVVRNYTQLEGLSSKISSKIWVTDSFLYVASPKGIDELFIQEESPKTTPKLYLGEVIVDGASVDVKQLDIAAKQNSLTIKYDGVSLASKELLTYHYFIEHLSKDTVSTHDNTIYLHNLPPGSYVFDIYASDVFGGVSTHERFSFSVAKSWYMTWWSWLLYLGCVAVILYAVVRYREQQTKKKLAIEARMSQLKLHALQSQLNPHFIFNALGAIQQYMFEHSPKEAEPYFSGFSHLMRLYLESSKKPTIPLSDELELIKTYISLEMLRFQDKFQFFFDIDKNLEVEYTKVPTMVLQPFVENAINHGLFHKIGKGVLSIFIKKIDDDFIRVIIQDDGVGRERAKEITQKRLKTHKSRSMQIIEERIKIMQSINPSDLSIEIMDLYDAQGNPSGTKVVIVLPALD